MSEDALPTNVTASDLLKTLDDPEEYVRRALGHMHEIEKTRPGARLTIGVTGKGIVPNYKIDYPETLDIEGVSLDYQASSSIFNGRTHNEMHDASKVQSQNWSENSMTMAEVQELLGKIRAEKKRRGKR